MEPYELTEYIAKMKEKAGKNSQLLQVIGEAEENIKNALEMKVTCDQQNILLKDGSYRTRCNMTYKKGDTPQCTMSKNLQCEHNYKLSQSPNTD